MIGFLTPRGFLLKMVAYVKYAPTASKFLNNLSKIITNSSTNIRNISTQSQDKDTDFGFQRVKLEEKYEKVKIVFDNVALRYDLMNDIMSAGSHRLFKDYLMCKLDPVPGTKLIDVAGGTGDVAFRFLNAIKKKQNLTERKSLNHEVPESHVTVCDINPKMLDIGKQKAKDLGFTSGITWVEGNAEKLPFENGTFDAYTVAFGIRNMTKKEEALEEAYRILKPGGRFLCLEFSHVENELFGKVYDWYSFQIIPVMGQLFAQDWKSYQYLVESIRQFPDQEEFKLMIEDARFTEVNYTNIINGIATIHSAFKL